MSPSAQRLRSQLFPLLAALVVAGCASLETAKPPPPAPDPANVAPKPAPPPAKPPPPAPKEPEPPPPPPKSVVDLRKGIASYEDGDYKNAAKAFRAALDGGLPTGAERASAHKYLAFMACVANRRVTCRNEFRSAFAADPRFDLAPAEAGHPTWGPVFRSVKAEVAKKKK
jgi:hypothetical protein